MSVAQDAALRRERSAAAFARHVADGLSRRPKSLPSMYFYDEEGSRLFQQITELDEYYLTRCEREILEGCSAELAERFSHESFRLVELGAGDGKKTKVLLRRFVERGLSFEYVPVDICEESLVALSSSLRPLTARGQMRISGMAAEYFDALASLPRQKSQSTCVLFLGSNIGNFRPPETNRFLGDLRQTLQPGDRLLIGFDLKKDPRALARAYNDLRGVTREFNFNLLDRINRELGGEFARERFHHRGIYNTRLSRMESWLVSLDRQQVAIRELGRRFSFRRGEGIHVECSYKYDLDHIERLAAASGFAIEEHFFDRRRWFVDSLWRAS